MLSWEAAVVIFTGPALDLGNKQGPLGDLTATLQTKWGPALVPDCVLRQQPKEEGWLLKIYLAV